MIDIPAKKGELEVVLAAEAIWKSIYNTNIRVAVLPTYTVQDHKSYGQEDINLNNYCFLILPTCNNARYYYVRIIYDDREPRLYGGYT